ncbi:MAG: hypothetical protein IPM25_19655 [Chloracidobacterium sp.]|nr:hypothetical protein [Chloracidobacterium sp.]
MSSTADVISHWSTLIENFNTSPQGFYSEVTKAIERRQLPKASIDRISFKESHLLSAKREYLRVSCRDFYFAICGAPFGTGFFVSYWLLEPPAGCLAVMFPRLSLFSRPWTYYRIDTANMFQTATHSAVLEVIDTITTSQGLRQLPDSERKPIMKGFLQ